jgi:hypothetical protein
MIFQKSLFLWITSLYPKFYKTKKNLDVKFALELAEIATTTLQVELSFRVS